MGCPRCQGLLLEEGDERRCVNCGYREFAEGDAMPRFISEESRQRWIASVRASKAAKRAKSSGAPLDVAPAASAVAVRPAEVTVVPSLDETIASLQADLAVLEQAREIVARRMDREVR